MTRRTPGTMETLRFFVMCSADFVAAVEASAFGMAKRAQVQSQSRLFGPPGLGKLGQATSDRDLQYFTPNLMELAFH